MGEPLRQTSEERTYTLDELRSLKEVVGDLNINAPSVFAKLEQGATASQLAAVGGTVIPNNEPPKGPLQAVTKLKLEKKAKVEGIATTGNAMTDLELGEEAEVKDILSSSAENAHVAKKAEEERQKRSEELDRREEAVATKEDQALQEREDKIREWEEGGKERDEANDRARFWGYVFGIVTCFGLIASIVTAPHCADEADVNEQNPTKPAPSQAQPATPSGATNKPTGP